MAKSKVEEKGIKEIREVLIGACELTCLFATQLKDGIQLGDFEAFFKKFTSDPEFKSKMVAAYEDCKLIPEEVKDISWIEGAELAGVLVGYVPKFIQSFKK